MNELHANEALIARFNAGESWRSIAESIGLPHTKLQWRIYQFRKRNNLQRIRLQQEQQDPIKKTRRARFIAQNTAFEIAMRRAIMLGLEKARIGVFKDLTPHPSGRLWIPDSIFSGCGSPAAACANAALQRNQTENMRHAIVEHSIRAQINGTTYEP